MRQVSLVALYGPKSGEPDEFLRWLRDRVRDSLARLGVGVPFRAYSLAQIHATLVGLERRRAPGLENRNFAALRGARRVMRLPGLFDVRTPALDQACTCAALIAAIRYRQTPPQKEDPGWKRATGYIRERMQVRPLNKYVTQMGQIVIFVKSARFAKEYDLARFLLSEWQRLGPGSAQMLELRARVEFDAGSYLAAYQAAGQYLKMHPKNRDLQKLRQECRKKISEVLQ